MSEPTRPAAPGAPRAPIARRGLIIGAAAVGAAGAAAIAMKGLPVSAEALPAAVAKKPGASEGGGYQLTAHVQRYYDTARS